MASYRFPSTLLHSMTEPQWLPRPKAEQGSLLDSVEKEEGEYLGKLLKEVIPPAPEPIGIAGATDETKASRLKLQREVDLKAIPPQPLFWEKYREDAERVRNELKAKQSFGKGF